MYLTITEVTFITLLSIRVSIDNSTDGLWLQLSPGPRCKSVNRTYTAHNRRSVLQLLLLKTCWFDLFLWFRNRKVRPSGNKQVCRKSRLVCSRDKTRAGRRRHNYCCWSTIINKVTCVTWSVTRTHARSHTHCTLQYAALEQLILLHLN